MYSLIRLPCASLMGAPPPPRPNGLYSWASRSSFLSYLWSTLRHYAAVTVKNSQTNCQSHLSVHLPIQTGFLHPQGAVRMHPYAQLVRVIPIYPLCVCVGGGGGRGGERDRWFFFIFFLNAQAERGSYAAHATPKSAHITPEQPHSLVCLHNSHLCLRCKPHIFNCVGILP